RAALTGVAVGGARWAPTPRAGRTPTPAGLLLRPVPQPADQPASRLRHDASHRAGEPRPVAHRVPVAVPAGGDGAAGLRSALRRGVLGHHQPAGLAGVRVGAAGGVLAG